VCRGTCVLTTLLLLCTAANTHDWPNSERPRCQSNPLYPVVDISVPTHLINTNGAEPALEQLRVFGVKTIFRYYDYEDESIRGKTLTPEERERIFAAKMNVAVIFQHNNDDPATFVVGHRGREDARRALTLAKQLGQPFGSAIYFGVDGVDDWLENLVAEYKISGGKPMTDSRKEELKNGQKRIRFYESFLTYYTAFKKPVQQLKAADIIPFVEDYLLAVKAVFDEASGGDPKKGYLIGAYGSGLTNFKLQALKHQSEAKPFLAYSWLAQSGAWPLFEEFEKRGGWALKQKMPTICDQWDHPWEKDKQGKPKRVDFDFNMSRNGEFGHWSKTAC
jgi:hypothetical protein